MDAFLAAATCVAALLGVVMVYSATRGPVPPYRSDFAVRQAIFVAVGVVVAAAVAVGDYRSVARWALSFYAATTALCAVVLSPLGRKSNGAQEWFQIGGWQLQPSELAKLGLILALAHLTARARDGIDLRRLLLLLAVTAAPLLPIVLQPDLGTALAFIAVASAVLLVAGTRSKHLLALGLVAVAVTGLVLTSDSLARYQRDRLTAFLEPSAAAGSELGRAQYNVVQSQVAVGSGGLTGRGLFEGPQTRLSIVPAQHTDFIFTAVAEQLGFVGAASLLGVLGIIIWRIWRAAQLARDRLGTLLCVGVLGLFMFHIFENVGMATGIMPVTGIPLPFISYGGSATIVDFAAVGLVLNVHMRRFR